MALIDDTIDRSLRDKREATAGEVRRLVEAALLLTQRDGRLEPRVSEIVKQAGLHNQAFYRHFRSKHELLVAVLDEGIGRLAGYLAHRMSQADGPRGQVSEWMRGVLEQALSRDAAEATRPFVLARGRLAESYPEEVRESERQLTALVRSAIADGIEAGEFPAADPDREAEILYLLAMGWVQNRLVDPQPPRREDALALEAFAIAGLARARSGA
jgi:AcrR family transcriptional regulator